MVGVPFSIFEVFHLHRYGSDENNEISNKLDDKHQTRNWNGNGKIFSI
jgi:hypothetical protein